CNWLISWTKGDWRSLPRFGPQPESLALLDHHDRVLLDALEDGAVLERLALGVLLAVHVHDSLLGRGRPDEHIDLELQLLRRSRSRGGWRRPQCRRRPVLGALPPTSLPRRLARRCGCRRIPGPFRGRGHER